MQKNKAMSSLPFSKSSVQQSNNWQPFRKKKDLLPVKYLPTT